MLRPEGEQPLGEGLAADRRHLCPGQDEALERSLDDAIAWPARAQQHPQVRGLLVNADAELIGAYRAIARRW